MNETVPFVDLAAQQAEHAGVIGEAIQTALRRTDWILGREVELFEEEFAAYCETAYAVGTDSGLSALELALRAFGVGAGDEVITVANTFVATAFAISHAGATPVLVDIDPNTYTIDPSLLERAITGRTKAIVPVHLYGHPVDLEPILDIAKSRDLIVVEDACQAHGARYNGRRVGSFGHAAAFSFYPAKNLGAFGDGGIVVTDDERLFRSLRMLRNYGQQEKYHHVVRGFNRRLDTLQAAILRAKLRRLDAWNDCRRACAALYDRLLAGCGVITPQVARGAEPVWHLYVVRLAERDGAASFLASRGIATGIHYPIPVHRQPAYADLDYPAGSFPVSERYAKEILSLPMYPELPGEAIERVVEALGDFVAEPLWRSFVPLPGTASASPTREAVSDV